MLRYNQVHKGILLDLGGALLDSIFLLRCNLPLFLFFCWISDNNQLHVKEKKKNRRKKEKAEEKQ